MGGEDSSSADRKWMVSPETTIHRLMNNDFSQHKFDNISEGTDNILDWGSSYSDTPNNSIILSNNPNAVEEDEIWSNIARGEYMGGMGFTNSSKFNTLYIGFPYHIWATDPVVYSESSINEDYYKAYIDEDADDSGILDTIDTSSPVVTIGEPANKFEFNLYHFQLLHQGFVENWDEQDYYIKAVGRNADFPSAWRHTFDLVNMLDVQLGDPDYAASNTNFYNDAHEGMKINFTLNERKPAIDIFSEMFQSTKSFFKIDSERKMMFPTIASIYTESTALVFHPSDILSYSFSKTKKIYNKCKVKYNYNYGLDSYRDVTETFDAEDWISDYSPEYYNIIEDRVLEFESKYIRDIDSANHMGQYLMFLNCNEHNVVKVTTPISKSIQLETGDLIAFDEELDGMRLYGMKYSYKDFTNSDYTEQYKINGQYAYPLWFITKITKDTAKATIEAVQLHHLSYELLSWDLRTWNGTQWSDAAVLGCTISTALNYDPEATEYDGSCIFPDQDDDAPVVDLAVTDYSTGSTIENGDYLEADPLTLIKEVEIKNNSYDPDDLEGTGYNSIYGIPNFSGTQTSEMYFQYAILINGGADGYQLNLEQEGIGDTWVNAYGTANPPILRFTISVDEITYDEEMGKWLIPLNYNDNPDLNTPWTYQIHVDAYDSPTATEPINTVPFQMAFQVKSMNYELFANGNVNGDGVLNILDVVLIINHITDDTLTEEQQVIADINFDGVVDILDVVLIINIITSADPFNGFGEE